MSGTTSNNKLIPEQNLQVAFVEAQYINSVLIDKITINIRLLSQQHQTSVSNKPQTCSW